MERSVLKASLSLHGDQVRHLIGFYAGLHGSDIYADSLKRKSRWIDSSGKVMLADMSTVDLEGNKKSEEKKEIK